MCHLCKNSWEISWVESHKHVTVETHKSYVWLVQSASCLTCSIHSHLANLCTQTTSLTSLQLPHFAKRPGADRTLWRAGSGPRAACLSLLSQQKHRQRSAFTLNVRMTYSGPRRHTRLVWSSSLWRTCDASPLINNYKNLRTNLNRLFQKAHLTLLLVVSLDWSRPSVCVRARVGGADKSSALTNKEVTQSLEGLKAAEAHTSVCVFSGCVFARVSLRVWWVGGLCVTLSRKRVNPPALSARCSSVSVVFQLLVVLVVFYSFFGTELLRWRLR